MRYIPLMSDTAAGADADPPLHAFPELVKSKQTYDAFLVLDVEATCFQGTDFNYPNEIIEFPVCLMKWKDRSADKVASCLEIVDEFRSFVRPTWRPTLSCFCTELTGITQAQVDVAPMFPDVLEAVQRFLVKNGLIDAITGERLLRYCWCTDGPFDIRDFVVKQCFISNISMPEWLQGDILDVRMTVMQWLSANINSAPTHSHSQTAEMAGLAATPVWIPPVRRSLNIPAQLRALGLPGFQGRQHSGIDDSRNIAKIVAELARRGASLRPNTTIRLGKRWAWMGKAGKILEEFCAPFDQGISSRPPSPSSSMDFPPIGSPSSGSPTPSSSPSSSSIIPSSPSYASSVISRSPSTSSPSSSLSSTSTPMTSPSLSPAARPYSPPLSSPSLSRPPYTSHPRQYSYSSIARSRSSLPRPSSPVAVSSAVPNCDRIATVAKTMNNISRNKANLMAERTTRASFVVHHGHVGAGMKIGLDRVVGAARTVPATATAGTAAACVS